MKKNSTPLAVVEAKSTKKHHEEGKRQAKEYAEKLDLFFAYSTNGYQIEFYDLKKGEQKTVDKFHTPDELFSMYLEYKGIEKKNENLKTLTKEYFNEDNQHKKKVRYYQELAITKTIEAILFKKQKRILLAMATGTGKTFTAGQIIYKLFETQKVQKILFIVDRHILADQAYERFKSVLPKDACWKLSSDEEVFSKSRDCYFAIYQTLVGEDDEEVPTSRRDRFKEFPKDFFDIIVVDEAHRGARVSSDRTSHSSWF